MARNLGDPGPDPTVHVTRRLTLVERGLREAVAVRARWSGRRHPVVRLELAGDGAELHEVKAGAAPGRPPAGGGRVDVAPRGATSGTPRRHGPGASTSVDDRAPRARWDVDLPPAAGERRDRVDVRADRTAPTPFDTGCGAGAVDSTACG